MQSTVQDNEPLPRNTRAFVVLVALLQGLLLYLAQTGRERGWWPFSELGGLVCWYTLVLSVPTMMSLSVRRLDDARFWQHVALVGTVFVLLAWWAAWSATGAPGLDSGNVLGPFGVTTALALFVALPYLQCRLECGRWTAPYPALFEHAWQNALTLALTLLFVGICWGVLQLWAALFALIRIDFFKELFRKEPFVYLATGAMAGLGILIGRTQQRPVQVARQILFAIFKGLLPLLAAISLLFVASLPFTGLEPLWKTRSAASLLLGVVIALVLFVNAVYQDGDDMPPYPKWLRRIVDASLAVLPVYAGLALYALWLRIAQHGWTAERLWAVLLALLLAGYALGYAWAALRRQGPWLQPLRRVNVALSLAAIAVAALANSPLLDPHRTGIVSQIARLRDGRVAADKFDYEHLRFDSGRRGYRAAQALRTEPMIAHDPERLAALDRLLKRKQRYNVWRSEEELHRSAVRSTAAARALIRPAAGAMAPDETWLQALVDGHLQAGNCLQADSECVLLTPDLDGDGVREHLLCDLGQTWGTPCRLHTLTQGQWSTAGQLDWPGKTRQLRDALRKGELQIRPRRWPDVEVAGQRGQVHVVEKTRATATPRD